MPKKPQYRTVGEFEEIPAPPTHCSTCSKKKGWKHFEYIDSSGRWTKQCSLCRAEGRHKALVRKAKRGNQ